MKHAYRPGDLARNNDLARIHILKAQLKLEEDDYRAQVQGLTGHTSAGDCDFTQRKRILDHFESLRRAYRLPRASGFGAARPGTVRSGSARRAGRSSTQRLDATGRKVVAMWMALSDCGVVAAGTDRTLDAFVKRQTGIESIAWCNPADKQKLIEALKAWAARAGLLGADGTIGGAYAADR